MLKYVFGFLLLFASVSQAATIELDYPTVDDRYVYFKFHATHTNGEAFSTIITSDDATFSLQQKNSNGTWSTIRTTTNGDMRNFLVYISSGSNLTELRIDFGTTQTVRDLNVSMQPMSNYDNMPDNIYSYSITGDVNFDGVFNSTDLVLVYNAGKYETNQSAGWEQGDWNSDNEFDSGDLVAAMQAGFYTGGDLAADWADLID